MADIIQLRRDTAANWTAANPILAQGEPALEIDTKKEKLGDGVTPWNDMPYKTAGATEPQITITTAVSITTDTLSGSASQNGRNTVIDNGVNPINLTVNGGVNFCASYLKHGTGAVTFLQGSGRTLIQVNGTNVMGGAVGSTATISSVGTTDYLRINNV